MMRIGILWDLDGTLLDTLEDIRGGVNHALRKFGYPERTLTEVRRFVGNGARRLITLAAPERADVDAVLAEFHTYYDAHCRIQTKPYEGILEALSELGKEFPMAVVSNKPNSAVKSLCEEYFPGLYARGESADCPRKPAPDMVFKAMEAIGVEACIYVGDSEVDVLTAKNAGVPCLSVLWGFRDREELRAAGATHYCASTDQLTQIIKEMVGTINGE